MIYITGDKHGHFHIDKEIDKMEFMSRNIKELNKKLILKKD